MRWSFPQPNDNRVGIVDNIERKVDNIFNEPILRLNTQLISCILLCICLKEHTNHTKDTVQEPTGFELGYQQKLVELSLSVVESKVALV